MGNAKLLRVFYENYILFDSPHKFEILKAVVREELKTYKKKMEDTQELFLSELEKTPGAIEIFQRNIEFLKISEERKIQMSSLPKFPKKVDDFAGVS